MNFRQSSTEVKKKTVLPATDKSQKNDFKIKLLFRITEQIKQQK